MHKSLDEFEIWPDPTTGFDGNRQCYNLKNSIATFSRLFLLGFFSYLQVMMTYIRARMSLKFGQIQPRTTELAALKRLKIDVSFFFLLCINPIHFKFVGIEGMHNIKEFEFRPDSTT